MTLHIVLTSAVDVRLFGTHVACVLDYDTMTILCGVSGIGHNLRLITMYLVREGTTDWLDY